MRLYLGNRLELKNVKAGDVFYEYDMGQTLKCKALEDAYIEGEGWKFLAEELDNPSNVIEYFGHINYKAYHPKIYLESECLVYE